MTRRKLVAFGAAAVILAVGGTLILLLGADLYLHRRAERSAGLNRWGYRGPVLRRKQPGEVRVAMLGGSTMFGYGLTWDEAIPALVEQQLHARQDGARFRTVNLGFNNEGAFASVPTLEDYAWLDYDIAVLYHGYNDSWGDGVTNTAVFRHESPVFRLTGYYPILPLALQEKAMALRSGGDLNGAYNATRQGYPRVTFEPNAAQRTSAAALEALSQATLAVSDQLDKVAAKNAAPSGSNEAGCERPWTHFCDSVYRAVKHARGRNVGVVVIAQPSRAGTELGDRLDDQRRQLAAMVSRHFGSDRGTLYLDFSRTIDPTDPKMSFDGMHLVAEANRQLAAALVEPLITLARTLGR